MQRGDADVTLRFSLAVESGGLRSKAKIHTMTVRVPVGFEQTISFTSTPPQVSFFGDTYTPRARATSLLPVSFAIAKASTGKCELTAGIVRLRSAGECTIVASQPGDIRWSAAPQVTQTLFANKASPEITFTTAAPFGAKIGGSYRPTATSTFGAPVALSINPDSRGICRLEDGSVIFENIGMCFVVGDVAATENTNPGTGSQAFLVGPATQDQTISFTSTPPTGAGIGGTYTPTATATSGLPVGFSTSEDSIAVCQFSEGVVRFIGIGECIVHANQPGGTAWNEAPEVSQRFSVGQTAQVITFAQPGNQTFAPGLTVALSATGGASGNPVVFTSGSAAVCTVNASTVTVTAAGSCTIHADQAGNERFGAAMRASRTFTVSRAQDNVAFITTPPVDAKVGGSRVPEADSESGLVAVITVDATSGPGVCAITNGVLSYLAPGTCRIVARTEGNASYLAAASQIMEFVVEEAVKEQTISFTSTAPGSAVFGGTYRPAASATSGLPVSFSTFSITPFGGSSSSAKGILPSVCRSSAGGCDVSACEIRNGIVSFTGVGTCTVFANQEGDAEWEEADEVSQSFEIGKAPQSIEFAALSPQTFSPAVGVALNALGGASGNPVTFTSDTPDVCVIEGDSPASVVAVKPGECSIRAAQAGNDNFLAATGVVQNFAISGAGQVIGFTLRADLLMAPGETLALTATGGASGNPVVFTSGSPAVCTVAGSVVTTVAAGTCSVHADQAGNDIYSAATRVTRSFAVGKAANSVAFTTSAPSRAQTGGSYQPQASALSGRTPVISVDPSSGAACSISGGVVSFGSPGTCKLIATDMGDERYGAADSATQSFAIVAPMSILPAPGKLADIAFGVAFNIRFEVSGGFGGHVFGLGAVGQVPPGLVFGPNGVLSGTPSQTGDYTFTVVATESSGGASINGTYTIRVTDNPDSLIITDVANSSAEASAITSGEIITDTVSDAGAEGFSEAPPLVTQYADGVRITVGKQGRVGNGGTEAIEGLTMADRKAIRERSGGTLPGLFAYADGGAEAADAVDPARFQAWGSVRYTRVTTSAALQSLDGAQINGLAGLNYRLNKQTVVGVFGGYETMDFDNAVNAGFKGEGYTGGVYGAWRPDMGLRFDAQISATKLAYDVNSGGVTGSFDATRVIAAAGVAGNARVGSITLEPSLKATTVWEVQSGYIDSVGTVHKSRDFHFGKVSAGLKAATTMPLADGRDFSPYAGVAVDWRFSGGDASPTLKAMDDLSVSANIGFNARLNSNTTLGVDGMVSGLGLDDVLIWSVRARLGVEF
jgi:outer membrane autotransporter protein